MVLPKQQPMNNDIIIGITDMYLWIDSEGTKDAITAIDAIMSSPQKTYTSVPHILFRSFILYLNAR